MRLNKIILNSQNIEAQKSFYNSVLGLSVTSNKQDFTVYLNNSQITFVLDNNAKPYHFAIDIPANMIEEALVWLKERTKVLKNDSFEIIDFPAWNAQSIYFYDADKNIVEFIARKNLKNSTTISFSSESLLNVSEIGLATTNFEANRTILTSELGLTNFGTKTESFNALGNEEGLIILIDNQKKRWFPTNEMAYSSSFSANLEINEAHYTIEYKNDKLKITKHQS